MLVLHASQSDIGLLIWGEGQGTDRAGEDASKLKKKSSKKKSKDVPRYPHGAKEETLRDALEEYAALPSDDVESLEASAWLPSRGAAACPSSLLIVESEQGDDVPDRISPWIVPALFLESDQALSVLGHCSGKRILAPGVVLGADIVYWTKALRFAAALVAKQAFLPGVRTIGDEPHAVWEPVLLGDDLERAALLAKAMPHAARALSNPEDKEQPNAPAISVLRAFLTDCVDALVRSSSPRGTAEARASKNAKSVFDSLHDAWIHALRAQDSLIDWNSKDVAALARTLARWRRPISLAATSPVRLCFRLEEPAFGSSDEEAMSDDGGASWRVSYLLQPHEDRSLMQPLSELWGSKSSERKVSNAPPIPREYVFSSLGQAAGLCPLIASSLKTSAPVGYELSTKAAYDFLAHDSILLEQAGFGVLLPSWWTRKGTKLRPTVRATVQSPTFQASAGFSLDTLVSFDWRASLGEDTLSYKELMALAKIKAPLVRLRGQWVEVNAQEIKAAAAFWKKKQTQSATVRDIVRMALGAGEAPHGFDFTGVDATGWIGDLLAQLGGDAAFTEIQAPDSFSGTLRPYQQRGYSWLAFLRQWGIGACLADDMGLGKTIQTLALLLRDWEAGARRPTLLVCPTSVVNNWSKEAERFTPGLPVMVHHGGGRKKDASFVKEVGAHALVISSYGLLQRDHKLFASVSWAGVILDEAQNIKNPETKQAKAARALPAEYRIALTGTPVENNVGDLWSIMEFLNAGLLGAQAEFRRSFFLPIQTGRDPEAAERLKRLSGPFVLRRLKTDSSIISDLPDKVEMKEFCTLTKEQATLYAAVLQELEDALADADGIQRKGVILATLTKLKQVCNHPTHFLGDNSLLKGRSGKLARLTEMIEEILDSGDRALIFTQFKEMGGLLKKHLQESFGREALFLHGGVTKPKRDAMVERFQSGKDAPPLFILSLKAGGTGLNLTAANHVFHFDRWWNPAVEDQATDRAFRIGQHRNVLVHKFVCSGTMEDRIDEMIERKKDVAASVVGTGEAWLTELSNEELKSVFALRKEALGE
jgi:SNF2 family DNA or RNA helicase